MKKMNIEIPESVLLNPEAFNPHKLTVEEMRYINGLIHVARTREQIDAITFLYCKIESITDAEERIFYMDKYFRELEKVKGYSDDNLRTSVVSKLTAKEFKQLFHSRNGIGKQNLIGNNRK